MLCGDDGMSNQQPYRIGEIVSPARWNKYEKPSTKLKEPVYVIEVEQVANCQSGWMITIDDSVGKKLRLDADWLEKKA
jgi:hypothetical protein